MEFGELTYIVAYNDEGTIHYVECEAGTSLITGQPHVETFTDEALAKARAEELGYEFPVEPEPRVAPARLRRDRV